MPNGASPLGWSIMGDYLDCERLCYYRNVLNLSPKKTPSYYAKGSIYHLFLQHHYNGTPLQFDLQAAIRDEQATGAIFDTIDIEHLEATTEYYIDQFAGWKVIATEKNFIIDLNGAPYTCRIDLLILDNRGVLHIVDHKTGEKNNIKKNLAHGALTGYWVGALLNGYEVGAITINQIVWATKDRDGVTQYTQVPPQSTTKQQQEIDTWKIQMSIKIKEYIKKTEEVVHEKDILNPISFNKNPNHCYNFGLCKFTPLCKYEINPDVINLMYKVGKGE